MLGGTVGAVFAVLLLGMFLYERKQAEWDAHFARNDVQIACVLLASLLQRLTLIQRLGLPLPEAFHNFLANVIAVIFGGLLGPECLSSWWTFHAYWAIVWGVVGASLVLAVIFEALREHCGCRRVVSADAKEMERVDVKEIGIDDLKAVLNARNQKFSENASREDLENMEIDMRAKMTFWTHLRLSPMVALFNYLGSGILLQVCVEALRFRTVSGSLRQFDDLSAPYADANNLAYVGVSSLTLVVAAAIILAVTLEKLSRTYRTHADRDYGSTGSVLWSCCRSRLSHLYESPAIRLVAAPRAQTGSKAYLKALEEVILFGPSANPTPIAVLVMMLSSKLSLVALALVPESTEYSNIWLIILDIASLFLLGYLFQHDISDKFFSAPVDDDYVRGAYVGQDAKLFLAHELNRRGIGGEVPASGEIGLSASGMRDALRAWDREHDYEQGSAGRAVWVAAKETALHRVIIPPFTNEDAYAQLACLCRERSLDDKLRSDPSVRGNPTLHDLRHALREQDIRVLRTRMASADAEAELARAKGLDHAHRLDHWTHFFIAYFVANSIVTQSVAVAWFAGQKGNSESKGFFLIFTNSLAAFALCVFILDLFKWLRNAACGCLGRVSLPVVPSATAAKKAALPLTSVALAPTPGLVLRSHAPGQASAPRADTEVGWGARPELSSDEKLKAALEAYAAADAQREAALAVIAEHRASRMPR